MHDLLSRDVVARVSLPDLRRFLNVTGGASLRKSEVVEKFLDALDADPSLAERFTEEFKQEIAVEPREAEKLLGISAAERLRWTQEGKLPILSHRQYGSSRNKYACYDRRLFAQLNSAQTARWREEDAACTKDRRRDGAIRAAATHEKHTVLRQSVAEERTAIFTLWNEQSSPETAAVFELGFWTRWASRWAKRNEVLRRSATTRGYEYDEKAKEWYRRKN